MHFGRSIADDHLKWGASASITFTFTNAAGGNCYNCIHQGAKTDGIARFREGFFDRDGSIRGNLCLHKNIKWMNDGKINGCEGLDSC